MSSPTPFDRHPIDDLAVYALDALDGPERVALERHLAGCPACRAELDALRATAAHLVRPTAPPAHLWRSITAALTPAPAAPGSAHDHPRPSAAPGTRAADGFPPGPAHLGPGPAW
ncbi:MAG TPA: zf-HC2 domain-containing protein, partial [Acidimicrobiales bacterium]|nr:zf-HC2 domain-containing protein [Acidimicrobiales bacterium]